ncbi:MAG: diguanylate cyclase [Clostridiaceae bacterium]|nr:diguanylate cyclase [Clostridiaceae bacterium]
MTKSRLFTVIALIVSALLLTAYYVWLLKARPDNLLTLLLVSGLALCLVTGLAAGRVAAVMVGLLIGFLSTWRLYHADLALWPLSSTALLSLMQAPGLTFWLLHPLVSLLLAQAGHMSLRRLARLQHHNEQQSQAIRGLERKLNQYEDAFRALSDKRLYRQKLHQLLEPDADQEPFLGALITVAFDMLRTGRRRQLLEPRTPRTALQAQPFFQLLVQLCPELVAVLDLKGHILAANEVLLAVFGFPSDKSVIGKRFTDCLLPADAPRALQDLERIIRTETHETGPYAMRSATGPFQAVPIGPAVHFTCGGDPLVILVRAEASGELEPARLAQGTVWCLSASRSTLYVSQAVAEWLAEQAGAMAGRLADRYISYKDLPAFHQFFSSFKDGQTHSTELTMQPRADRHVALRLTGWPVIGGDKALLGVTLLAEDISERMAVERVLNHQVKMEQLISQISKRFVAVPTEEMDAAIEEVLQQLGSSENAMESSIEIFRSPVIRRPARYHVRHERPARYHVRHERPARQEGALGQEDPFETISVPILLAEERLGYFHFSMQKYQNSWLENDLPLVRLIGEIIVNALIRKEHEQQILVNEKRLTITLQSIGDAVIATDKTGLVITMNRAAEKLTGWTFAEAGQRLLTDVMHTNRPLSLAAASETPDEAGPELLLWARDGQSYFIDVTLTPIEDAAGAVYGDVIVFRDITRQKQEADEIRYISYHDSLTGLYNRAFFEEELKRLNTKRQYPITLILGDCNGLKIANDIFGHLEGDRLLIAIADIMRKATRQEDIVARWGGDEFAVILPRTDEVTAASVRERILALCAEAEANPIRPSLALGSATNMDNSTDLDGLLKLAEDRMYRHKLMEGKSARNAILQSIKKMLYEKSYETEEHAGRMINIAHSFGRVIGLSIDEMEELSLLAVLHDMGKIGIPDHILRKNGRLTPDEWDIMKKHPEKGYNIAKSTPELSSIAQLILHHHEHWDGTGYPDGLHGEKIPKLSRVLAIIDAYDVITHHRAYKVAQSEIDALDEIKRCAGSQFDPELAQSFVHLMLNELDSRDMAAEEDVESSEMAEVNAVGIGLGEAEAPVT